MLIDGEKWACEVCVRGHRSSTCNHRDRPLKQIKRKGRPVSKHKPTNKHGKASQNQLTSIAGDDPTLPATSAPGFSSPSVPDNNNCRRIQDFVCDSPGCGKKYGRQSPLYRHKLNHQDPRFLCSGCKYRTSRFDVFRAHNQVCKDSRSNGLFAVIETRYQGAPLASGPAPPALFLKFRPLTLPNSTSNKEQLSLDAAPATSLGQFQTDPGAPPAPSPKQTLPPPTPTPPYSTSNEERLSLDAAFPTFGQLPFPAEGSRLNLGDILLTRQSDDGASGGGQLAFVDRFVSTQPPLDWTSDGEQLAFPDWISPSPLSFPERYSSLD